MLKTMNNEEELNERKSSLRKEMLQNRSQIDASIKAEYDIWVCNQLYDIVQKWDYQIIHAYIPMGDEINILPLIDKLLADGRVILAPKTLPNRKLEHLVLQSTKKLEKGVFGTSHPANSIEYIGDIDLIITPGLAYDYKGNRLGYGGGYYDTFLSEHSQAYAVGIAYPFQRMKFIPLGKHDIPVNEVLSKREM